ncbi:MAG: hypothetical protein Q8P67_27920 [archaeon]|nr:hypothetical protein [archaeon]
MNEHKNRRFKPINKKNSQTNVDRRAPEGSGLRSQSAIKRLKMYSARPIRDKDGKLIHGEFMSKDTSHNTRIAPNRKWFGNTRTVDQTALEKFRDAFDKTEKDPYSFVLRQAKLPMGLIQEDKKEKKMHIVDVVPFTETFSKKRRQKKHKLNSYDYESLVQSAETIQEKVSFSLSFFFSLLLHPIVLLISYLHNSSMSKILGDIKL